MVAPAARVRQNLAPIDANQEECCPKMKDLAILVAQMAVRVLFVVVSILVTAAAFPLHFHALAIPIAALGATALAGFFFPQPQLVPRPRRVDLPPLLRPIAPRVVVPQVPPNLFQEAPRPLYNASNNCAFNSLVHFFESDPTLRDWFRHPLRDDMDMAAFELFLDSYQAPERVKVAFRAYVDDPANPRAPIPEMFGAFINGQHAMGPEYVSIRSTYNNLRLLQEPFANFFAAYDQAVRENRQVGTSQELRFAVNRIHHDISPHAQQQEDAADIMTPILGLLPPAQKMRIREFTRYNTTGLPAIRNNPEGVIDAEDRHGVIHIAVPQNEANPSLERMIHNHFHDQTVIERKDVNGMDRSYPAEIVRQFLEPPTALRIQLKRFDFAKPSRDSWLTRLKLWWWPELQGEVVKRDDPVAVPPELTVVLANGERRRYQLASFVYHRGSTARSGHYMAGRIINGRKYLMSDQEISLVDQRTQAEWDKQLRGAYLLNYVPVPA